MSSTRKIEIDVTVNAAYVRLSDEPVTRTVSVTDDVLLDLDNMGVAVGVEVLDIGADIPFARLVSEFHVHSEVVQWLQDVRPTIKPEYSQLTQATDGVSHATNFSYSIC